MAYFIFNKNSDNLIGTIHKIAKDQSDLNNLNINKDLVKIIEDSEVNFNNVRLGKKIIEKYNNNTITYLDNETSFYKGLPTDSISESLKFYITDYCVAINYFLKANPNHPLYSKWDSYRNQMLSLDLTTIAYPLQKSLEQYFEDLGQPSLNPLQLP